MQAIGKRRLAGTGRPGNANEQTGARMRPPLYVRQKIV
jgi:hypothetical protein